ncbi:MAG: FHA domain-containing protein [Clostridiales bacterium]|jgi:hypothetical protein|nr:FHA domain-containing protein [Clostridiales bacterium]
MGVSERGCGRTRAFHGAVSISGTAGFFGGKTLGIRAGDVIAIGRDRSACALLYPPGSTEISKVHCKLRLDAQNGCLSLTDSSKNGTYLRGGERLAPGREHVLADGEAFFLATEDNGFVVSII